MLISPSPPIKPLSPNCSQNQHLANNYLLLITMTSICTARCVDDVRVPVRASYTNLYKWPESDRAFIRSVSSNGRIESNQNQKPHPTVVDSLSCRQMYLRSYTFTRKESVSERTRKCFGRVTARILPRGSGGKKPGKIRRVKEVSCAALARAFHGMLSCTTKVDVVD